MDFFPHAKITSKNLAQFITHLKSVDVNVQEYLSNYDLSTLSFLETPLLGDNDSILQKLHTCWKLNVARDATNFTRTVIEGRGALQFN